MRETLPAGVTKEERRPKEVVIDRPDYDSRAAKGPVQVRAADRLPYRYIFEHTLSAYVGILIRMYYRHKRQLVRIVTRRPQHVLGKSTWIDYFLLQFFDPLFCP